GGSAPRRRRPAIAQEIERAAGPRVRLPSSHGFTPMTTEVGSSVPSGRDGMPQANIGATGPAGFSYEARPDDGVATVVAEGDIDLANTPEIERGVDDLLSRNRVSTLVIDLALVEFMDSTGLRMLWEIRQKAQDAQAKLVLRAPSSAVMRLLRLTGMHRIFQI